MVFSYESSIVVSSVAGALMGILWGYHVWRGALTAAAGERSVPAALGAALVRQLIAFGVILSLGAAKLLIYLPFFGSLTVAILGSVWYLYAHRT